MSSSSNLTIKGIEEKVNNYAGSLLLNYTKSHGINEDDIKVSPFKLKYNQKKGGGRLSRGINQSQQLRDFESFVSPGNFVINFI
jgi:hypothetical protein